MTNKEWLLSLPKKHYDLYNTYALMFICKGDLDRYYKWLEQTCAYQTGCMPGTKKEDNNA